MKIKKTKSGHSTLIDHAMVIAGVLLVGSLSPALQAQTTGFNQGGAGAFDYNNTANWVNGTINGIWDPTLTLTANQTTTFAANTTATNGLTFNYANGFSETLRGTGADRILTLGGNISSIRSVTIGSTGTNQHLDVNLGGAVRTVTVSGEGNGGNFGNSVIFVNSVSNGGILAFGGATGGGLVRLDNVSNTLASAAVKGADLGFNGSGNGGANTVNTITGALTAANGTDIVTLSSSGSRNTLVQAGSFVREAGATVLFRGTNLGVNTIASATANSTNVGFTTGPALSGGGGAAGTTTVSILTGAFGSTSNGGTGFGATGGLVTYDSANGVRLLGSSEYLSTLVDGNTALNNVRILNSSGVAYSNTLASALTTINSLSIGISGAAGNQGVTINGTGGAVLKLNSGVIYLDQSITSPGASDATTLGSGLTLDLNGQEGIILANTTLNGGGTQLSTAGLFINSTITNGTGLTIGDLISNGGSGYVVLGGSAANTYTGNTTINGAIVKLDKSISNSFGNIVVNHGAVYDNGNQVADTANVTVSGTATFYLNGSNNSGSASNETINDLTMTGGFVSSGSGNSNIFNVNGNVNLSGGSINMAPNAKLNVAGTTNLNGGVISVASNNSSSLYNSRATLTGPLNITNTAAGTATYVPISIAAGNSAGNLGGQLVLSGDLTFTGNSTNRNTTTIAAPTGGGQQGTIGLNGIRTFNIGDGAAAVDLTVNAGLADGTSAGGLNKTGAGTLALNGVNTYLDETTVSAGTLLVNGSLNNTLGVTVASGARLGGSGTINATVGGAGSINPGNSPGVQTILQVDPSSGMDFNFEFNLANSLPTFANTENDILRLTNISNPFTQALAAGNVLTLYIDVNTLTNGDVFSGGFYTDGGNFLSSISGGSIVAYLENTAGAISYNGKNYDLVTGGTFSVGDVANSNYSGTGYVTQFTYSAVPEPSTYALVGLGLGALWFLRRRKGQVA